MAVTERDEVLLARMHSSPTIVSSSEKRVRFAFRSSTIASITTWQGASACRPGTTSMRPLIACGSSRAPFRGEPRERLRDRIEAALGRAGLRVVDQRAHAALRKHLRDAAAHGAAAGNAGDKITAGGVEHGGRGGYFSGGRWL